MPALLRPDHHRRRRQGQERRRVPVPRHRLGAEVRRLPQGLPGRQGPGRRGRRGAEAPAAGGDRRRAPAAPRDQARAALHRAAAALQRSHAGEAAGSGRRGPALHLRFHSLHHPGARVRQEGRRPLHPHRAGHGGDRPAARELRRHLRREVHRAHGRGARRDRRGQARLARRPWPSSTRSSTRT